VALVLGVCDAAQQAYVQALRRTVDVRSHGQCGSAHGHAKVGCPPVQNERKLERHASVV
jgi:hypothetical protein